MLVSGLLHVAGDTDTVVDTGYIVVVEDAIGVVGR